MAKLIKFSASMGCSVGKVTDECEVPENWDDLTDKEQDKLMEERTQDFIGNNVSVSVWVEEE